MNKLRHKEEPFKPFSRNPDITSPSRSNQEELNKKKVFAIGFNKSGTTSIHHLFQTLGLNSYHGLEWRKCADLRFFFKFDCFSDGPPDDFMYLDKTFMNSKFILNVRQLETWVLSRLSHIERQKEKFDNFKLWPTWDTTTFAIKSWIKERNEYHISVLEYFAKRSTDLLIIDYIRDPSAASKISNHLGFPGEHTKPRENAFSPSKYSQLHKRLLSECVEELGIAKADLKYNILCPSLLNAELLDNFPSDTELCK